MLLSEDKRSFLMSKEIIYNGWCIPAEFDGTEILARLRELLAYESAVPMLLNLPLSKTSAELEQRQQYFDQMYDLMGEYSLTIGARSSAAVCAKIQQENLFLEREELAILGLDCLDFLEFQQLVQTSFPLLLLSLLPAEKEALQELVLSFACFAPNLQLKDSASAQLAEIRRDIRSLRDKLLRQAKQFLGSEELSEFLQEDFYVELNGRIVLLIKTNFKGKLAGIAHGISHSGNTTYFEPQSLVSSNNALQTAIENERQEIQRILAGLNARVFCHKGVILPVLGFLQKMDVLRARVLFCREFKFCRPLLSHDNKFMVRGFFHPLVKNCVANNIELGPEGRILVLSGPNSGGKTICLKSLALCCYFASLGMYVAAEECILPFFQHHLFILGDQQSIVDSLSTFAAHLKAWRRILAKADERAVLFVDEIMDATDPREGELLACEILRYLGRSGCRAFVSTHYNEVKRLALNSPIFMNASMKFNEQCLEPEFVLCSGVPGRSYGIELAEKFNLPRSVTAKARKALGQAHFELNTLIEKQKLELLALRDLRQREARLLDSLGELRENLQALQTDFIQKRELYLEKAYKNVLKEHAKFRRRWEGKQTADVMRADVTSVSDVSEELDVSIEPDTSELSIASEKLGLCQVVKEAQFQAVWVRQQQKYAESLRRYKTTDDLCVGDTVLVRPYNKLAKVTELMLGRRELKVEMGAVTLILPLTEVEKSSDRQIFAKQSRATVKRVALSSVTAEIDLRGLECDEAVYELETHLDRAFSKGAPSVLIICGKGVLRHSVLEYLKRNPLTMNQKHSFPNDGSVLLSLD